MTEKTDCVARAYEKINPGALPQVHFFIMLPDGSGTMGMVELPHETAASEFFEYIKTCIFKFKERS